MKNEKFQTIFVKADIVELQNIVEKCIQFEVLKSGTKRFFDNVIR